MYVYIWIDPRTKEPFYIGMGRAARLEEKSRNPFTDRVVAKITARGQHPEIVVHSRHIIRARAQREEMRLIRKYGRRVNGTGCLTNLTPGGDGGNTFQGRKHRPETKEKMRIAATGRVLDAETREKIGVAKRGKRLVNGEYV